jgi:hypothetical protein
VPYQDEIEEGCLIDLDEVRVPVLEVLAGSGGGGSRAVVVGGVVGAGLGGAGGGVDMLVAVLYYLGEDLRVDVGERDAVVGAIILDHVADGLRLHRDRLLHLELLAVGALERDHLLLALGRHGGRWIGICRRGGERNPSSSCCARRLEWADWGLRLLYRTREDLRFVWRPMEGTGASVRIGSMCSWNGIENHSFHTIPWRPSRAICDFGILIA